LLVIDKRVFDDLIAANDSVICGARYDTLNRRLDRRGLD
jgi:hypothetical protein